MTKEKETKLREAAQEYNKNLKKHPTSSYELTNVLFDFVKYFHAQQPKIDLSLIASKAFSAGRDYQNGEHSEWHGGHEHDYPNFSEWFEKQELPRLHPAPVNEVDPVEFARWCFENCGIYPKDKGKKYSINERFDQAGWTFDQLLTEFKQSKTNGKNNKT